MIFFWLTYFFLSCLISFLLSLLVKNTYFRIIVFSFSLALMVTVWFKVPGESIITPIIPIILLESTILENNGFERILRPLGFVSFFLTVSILFIWKRKSKN